MTETALLSRLLVRASQLGMRVWRNNCGQLKDARGHFVRYGVANPGGSDLIGWTSVVVDASMVGRRIAVFTAIEAKVGRNTTTEAQDHFLHVVRNAGGIACVARQVSDIDAVLEETATFCDCPAHR
jgi:hypothetical protein